MLDLRRATGGVVMRKPYPLKKNLCNKSTHYETYIDGQPEGDKIAEITFTWSKINW